MKSKRRNAAASQVVSFRLDEGYCSLLSELAKRDRTSMGAIARRSLIDFLESQGRGEFFLIIEELKRGRDQGVALAESGKLVERLELLMSNYNQRLSDSVQMLLVNAGKLTPEQAREYARRYLLDRPE